MSEYIEREYVKVMLKRECSPRVMAYLVDELDKIPAADVAPVVLCRDCEYWKQWDNTTHYLCTYVAGAKFIRNAEDFCSRGEKREES